MGLTVAENIIFPPTDVPSPIHFFGMYAFSLVTLANQVIGEAFDGGTGVARDLGLAMHADDNGLFRLGNGDTVASLFRL